MSRAGIKAKTTNDEIFDSMSGLETSSDESDMELDSNKAVTPAKNSSAKRGSSASKSSGSSRSSAKKAKKSHKSKSAIDDTDFETAMVSYLKDISSRNIAHSGSCRGFQTHD